MPRNNVKTYEKHEDYWLVVDSLEKRTREIKVSKASLLTPEGKATPKYAEVSRLYLRQEGLSGRRRWVEAACIEVARRIYGGEWC